MGEPIIRLEWDAATRLLNEAQDIILVTHQHHDHLDPTTRVAGTMSLVGIGRQRDVARNPKVPVSGVRRKGVRRVEVVGFLDRDPLDHLSEVALSGIDQARNPRSRAVDCQIGNSA